jgi:predicted alpha/beta-fold hydrolase
MPILEDSLYYPPKLFANGHVQTIYPYFFRKIKDIQLERKRINTLDGDFLDLDILKNNSSEVVILSHGLEGSSKTPYIRGMAKAFDEFGKDVIAWNMRSCSEEMNLKPQFYHAGSTPDLEQIINFAIEAGYQKIHLVGFSLGANLTAMYLGQEGNSLPSEIVKAVLISTPFDLRSSSIELSKTINKMYLENFLVTMRAKILKKHKQMELPQVDLKNLKRTKTFRQFDDYFNAPIHGFKDAEDYWAKCSSIKVLHNIKIPTLMLTALDDPFMGEECYPIKEAKSNTNLFLETPKSGGHVGFIQFNDKSQYWSEKRATDFIIHDNIIS